MAIMKNQPTPSDHEVLTGLVERVTYQNAENGFCVVRIKARGHRELVILVGHAAAISTGELVTATGSWVNDRTHGQQFRARLKTSAPTSIATERVERRLTAILAADVAATLGLWKLMRRGSHAQLRDHLRSLFNPKIAEHRGQRTAIKVSVA